MKKILNLLVATLRQLNEIPIFLLLGPEAPQLSAKMGLIEEKSQNHFLKKSMKVEDGCGIKKPP